MGNPQIIPRISAIAPSRRTPKSLSNAPPKSLAIPSAVPERTVSSESTAKGKSEGITLDMQSFIPRFIDSRSTSEKINASASEARAQSENITCPAESLLFIFSVI